MVFSGVVNTYALKRYAWFSLHHFPTLQYVRSRDFQNFSDALLTKFSYPWCSVERTLCARELRYDFYTCMNYLHGLQLCTIDLLQMKLVGFSWFSYRNVSVKSNCARYAGLTPWE